MHGRPRVGGPKRGAGGEVVAGLGTRDERCAHEMRGVGAQWRQQSGPLSRLRNRVTRARRALAYTIAY